MRIFKYLSMTLLLALFSAQSMGGSGHSHEPVSQKRAEEIASRIVVSMVNQGVIEKSWKDETVEKSERKAFAGRPEWVISFVNPDVADQSKQTLYVFLTLSGEYLAANYSGE